MSDIPDEVWWVTVMQMQPYIGMSAYEKMTEIMARYPEYFPWETKYNSIPNDVHEAFRNECWPDAFKGWDIPIVCDKGFFAQIKEQGPVYTGELPKGETFFSLYEKHIANLKKQERDEIIENKRLKKIWDKHYSKYGLPYRP